jgi:DNA-directed RNA polymerase III subunit RPC6
MVYSMIDEAGADGIWTRTLKARLGMHDSVFKAAVKALESRGYVSQLKSVEAVNKKMLIRADLRPSDRATGGPWYTDSDLDEAFIAQLEVVIFDYITRESAWRGKEEVEVGKGGRMMMPKKGVVHGGTSSSMNGHATEAESSAESGSKGRKRGAEAISTDTADMEAIAIPQLQHPPSKKPSRREVLLPYAAGYTSYPTVRDIAELIDKSGITNNTTLSEEDVQQLVDVLVFDGVIEPVKMGREAPPKPLPSDTVAAVARDGGHTDRITKKEKGKRRIGYRTTRIAKQDLVPAYTRIQEWRDKGLDESAFEWPGSANRPTNGFVEVPCGRCPVFELCEEGGPVNPSNCEYFQRWLGKDVA